MTFTPTVVHIRILRHPVCRFPDKHIPEVESQRIQCYRHSRRHSAEYSYSHTNEIRLFFNEAVIRRIPLTHQTLRWYIIYNVYTTLSSHLPAL